MAHIASCIRPDADKSVVYIAQEPSPTVRGTPPLTTPPSQMNHHAHHRTASLKDVQTARDPSTSRPALTKSTSLANLHQPSPTKYQLWPSKKSPVGYSKPNASSDKLAALSVGRSSTSLSDTAILPESAPFWQRGTNLARRRKISVPELGNTMSTVQEVPIDSPTIPGMPPLRNLSSEAISHERSYSSPGTKWRAGPFGDAMLDCVTGPLTIDQLHTPGKQLSPILSAGVSPKPSLKVETTSTEQPPRVPPKSPVGDRKASPTPLVLSSRTSKSQATTPPSVTSSGPAPWSALDARRPSNGTTPLATPPSVFTNPFNTASPSSARGSPRIEKRDPVAAHLSAHSRNASESSIMDRGRPKKRNANRDRSRTTSESNQTDVPDTWQLPHGMRIPEASRRMSDADKKLLHKQAYDQAGNFEILNKRDVASLSRELRALDERCEYLRKTYKSLRSGRQKLHGRMIAYLKRGETVIFSRESLLKQEEALAELDVSIDEFISKLEQAENRRLRLRQKLLEHVAAAIVLGPTHDDMADCTPPRSPVKMENPAREEQAEMSSIKVYADGHVLNLFSDIEKAIGKMCEQTA